MSLCLARPPLGGVRTGGTSVWRCSSEEAHPGREGVRQRARVRREPAGTEPRATGQPASFAGTFTLVR